MKKEFSKKWIASIQRRKQRKFRANSPLHLKQKLMSAHLHQDLRRETGRRSLVVRKDDEVIVMRGSLTGLRGNVDHVDMKKFRVFLDNVKVKKADGSEVLKPINVSNVMITKLNLDDKKRKKIIERKKGAKVSEDKLAKVKTKETKKEKTEEKKEMKTDITEKPESVKEVKKTQENKVKKEK